MLKIIHLFNIFHDNKNKRQSCHKKSTIEIIQKGRWTERLVVTTAFYLSMKTNIFSHRNKHMIVIILGLLENFS